MRMYNGNELLFPAYAIPKLKDLRGLEWRKLVERISKLPEAHPDSLAFSLMMIRLDGCANCHGVVRRRAAEPHHRLVDDHRDDYECSESSLNP